MTSSPNHDDLPFEILDGRYRAVRTLGRGGMGAVVEVEDLASGEHCALKLLHEGARDVVAELFEREFQTLAGLKHSCIVEVYEYGVAEQGAYYTMELLSGDDLAGGAPMPWREVCACLRDVAAILGVLHARRLVHRDLSPRNLWRTAEGRIKLLDFGALAPFGASDAIVGTPPMVPPEAVAGQPLDARSDLYSLGTLGYWLLSAVHAYPARALRELTVRWESPPPSFAALARSTLNPQLAEVPRPVSDILFRLLRLDPAERFQSTQELIDQLNVAADLDRDIETAAATGYLHSAAFVGRAREIETFEQQLDLAYEGRPCASFVRGSPGSGRSRLLDQLRVRAQLAGMTTLRVRAIQGAAPYALATALGEALLRAVPEEARGGLRRHGAALRHLSPTFASALQGIADDEAAPHAGESRRRVQEALQGWFAELSQGRPLALLVDDVDAADEPSCALLATLARLDPGHRLVLAVTAHAGPEGELSPTLRDLRARAVDAELEPFSLPETTELLESMLGRPPYLERLAERIYRGSQGHPAHCLELVHYLVEENIVRYAEGGWSLPQELDADSLPSRSDDGRRRLERLAAGEIALARRLSVHRHGALSHDLCLAAMGADCEPALRGLLQAGVLVGSPAHYRFAVEGLRASLAAELDEEGRHHSHGAFADALLAGADEDAALPRLIAAHHLLQAGRWAQGQQVLTAASRTLLSNVGQLQEPVPQVMQSCIELLKGHGAGPHVRFGPVMVMLCAGFLIHYRFTGDHLAQAPALMEQVLRLDVATRARRLLGAKLALFVALLFATVGHWLRRRQSLPPGEAITALVQAATWQAGIGATTLDPVRTRDATQLLQPFAVLGPDHVAGIVNQMAGGFLSLTQNRMAEYNAVARSVTERLSSSRPIAGLRPDSFQRMMAGALVTLGSTESFKSGDSALLAAERIDALGPEQALYADQVRHAHHQSRGHVELAAHYRKRLELHAVQLGNCWQMEFWASVGALRAHCQNRDAVAVKRSAQDLRRLAGELPSMEPYACWGEAEYELLHGRHARALRALDASGYPRGTTSEVYLYGARAAALRGLGRMQEALEAAEKALAPLSDADLEFILQNYAPRLEHALALAGVGRATEARAAVREMRERHGDGIGPVLQGKLLETSALIERAAGDESESRKLLERACALYRSTGMASLRAYADSLLRPEGVDDGTHDAPIHLHMGVAEQLMSHVTEELRRSGETRLERGEEGLRLISRVTETHAGFVVFPGPGAEWGKLGAQHPPDGLLAWARDELERADFDDATAVLSEDSIDPEPQERKDIREFAGARYQLTVLPAGPRAEHAAAAIVLQLPVGGEALVMPDGRVLGIMGQLIAEARTRRPTRRTRRSIGA